MMPNKNRSFKKSTRGRSQLNSTFEIFQSTLILNELRRNYLKYSKQSEKRLLIKFPE